LPIISFTDSDKLAAVVVDAGYYKAVVKSIDMKASKSESSTNFWTEIELTEGKNKGKELKVTFNTKTSSNSILGDMQLRPYSDMLMLYAAIFGLELEAVPLQFDTDEMLMKEFDLQVLNTPTENGGGIMNSTGVFLPAGKASSAAGVTF